MTQKRRVVPDKGTVKGKDGNKSILMKLELPMISCLARYSGIRKNVKNCSREY